MTAQNKRPRSKELLDDFAYYCIAHPDERFWQALRNWAGVSAINVLQDTDDKPDIEDTFYWTTKNG